MKIPISDEATRAAAEMIAGIEQTDWERWEDIAEHALRAAAPHLMAQALNDAANEVAFWNKAGADDDISQLETINWLRSRARRIGEGK